MKHDRVMILGSNGYLGKKFHEAYPEAITTNIDIMDQRELLSAIDVNSPNVIINAAGKTGRPNVDWCEDHKKETLRSNVTAPLMICDEALKRNIYFVHISSGCIYQNGEFGEDDEPNFKGSYYSKTKAFADQLLADFPALVLRLRMPFDDSLGERTLIGKILKYKRVIDVKNSLTYTPDFVETAQKLIDRRKTGIYNVVNTGSISPFEIMEMYKEHVDPNHEFEKLPLEELGDYCNTGRSNCRLSTKKLAEEGLELPPIHTRLKEAMQKIAS